MKEYICESEDIKIRKLQDTKQRGDFTWKTDMN